MKLVGNESVQLFLYESLFPRDPSALPQPEQIIAPQERGIVSQQVDVSSI